MEAGVTASFKNTATTGGGNHHGTYALLGGSLALPRVLAALLLGLGGATSETSGALGASGAYVSGLLALGSPAALGV